MERMARETGVVYAAVGGQYVKEALNSLASLRACSSLPACIVTDESFVPGFDQVIPIESVEPKHGTSYKIQALQRTPFDRSLVLDTDTYVCRDPEPLFDILDTYDIALRRAPWVTTHWFPRYSAGLILTRKLPALADRWWDLYWERDEWANQASLRTALLEAIPQGLQLFELPPEVEFKLPNKQMMRRAPWVLHSGHIPGNQHELGPELCRQVMGRPVEVKFYIPQHGCFVWDGEGFSRA